jgi:hypothetical protein
MINYVAWLCWKGDSEERHWIALCDSDTPGAFKVWRQPVAPVSDREHKLLEALREIANPISFMHKRAASEGAKLDGRWAVALSDDPQFLKSIAWTVLREVDDVATKG